MVGISQGNFLIFRMSGEDDMSHGKGLDDKRDTRATTSETSSGSNRER